ncbi:hypothetical protein VD0002_g1509 [Verticillium dahliae]|uniref:Zn(2)-C6 fungal-type domain-containing protein n=1 Tax=Verticillium dahliae TaxID=27337 RepID=A0AA44WEN6_VERDA|nr:hypothetical protein BJF96_g8997 [Verticillium dahliae]PNH54703.1 hypothetical protein VD0003_g2806 [Verticillium dahliae]PNH68580.1 hypothetical protein VD0002_g1509 [Verticillium dahliae]
MAEPSSSAAAQEPSAGRAEIKPSTAGEGHRKRNRIRFSCSHCREKKLKCNRASPCDQCIKRDIVASCDYVPYLYPRTATRQPAPVPQASSQPQGLADTPTLQAKLKHLEDVLSDVRAKLAERGIVMDDVFGQKGGSLYGRTRLPETPSDLSGIKEPTPAGPMVDKLRYVDSANWEAILDDVTRLTDELKTTDTGHGEREDDDADDLDSAFASTEGPVLLLGTFPPATTQDLMDYLPQKDITDRLIARFFKGKEPAWSMFHVPAFLREYATFWERPHEYSITWIGLLCIMISHAAFFCLRGDEEVPGNIGPPQYILDLYRIRSAQCLALDDYTKPGKYKVEALILYFGTEYLRLSDAQRGTSIMMAIIVRLAMHSGLHRDPKHFQGLTVFEHEMRKRLWTILVEIDVLVAFQFGLPGNVQHRYFDTGLPHNLHDEDFDETTTELPLERPLTERTPALYTIVKSRLVVAFGDILARMADRDSPTYGEVLRLNDQLEKAHEDIPPVLRARSFSLSIGDPIDLIMQRLWIELMYLKARIVLHRRYFALGRNDQRYAPSRFNCIDAATKTLEYQFDVNTEIQPGGRLSKERWFLSSLSTHDFLLANMMLCLELSFLLRASTPSDAAVAAEPIEKDRLLHILRTSRGIWGSMRTQSAEASRAFKILSRMLTISTGTQYESSPDSAADGNAQPGGVDLNQRPSYQFASGVRAFASEQHPSSSWGPTTVLPYPAGSLEGAHTAQTLSWTAQPGFQSAHGLQFDSVGDPGMGSDIDWSSWDTQIQNNSAENIQIPWTHFFAQKE